MAVIQKIVKVTVQLENGEVEEWEGRGSVSEVTTPEVAGKQGRIPTIDYVIVNLVPGGQ